MEVSIYRLLIGWRQIRMWARSQL